MGQGRTGAGHVVSWTGICRRAMGLGLLLLSVITAGAGSRAQGGDLKVVATIKPVHSLVAQVMAGLGQPDSRKPLLRHPTPGSCWRRPPSQRSRLRREPPNELLVRLPSPGGAPALLDSNRVRSPDLSFTLRAPVPMPPDHRTYDERRE